MRAFIARCIMAFALTAFAGQAWAANCSPAPTVGKRHTPDLTNATVPYNARDYECEVNVEVKGLWKRTPEKLGSIGGTADAITATAAGSDVSALTAYSNLFLLVPASDNTTAVTLNVDSLGVKDVMDADGNPLTAGMLKASRPHLLYFNGTEFRMLANGAAAPPTVAQPGPIKVDGQSCSSCSAIVFQTGLDNTYNRYQIQINGLKPANDQVDLRLRIGTGAGPTYQTTGYLQTLSQYRASDTAYTLLTVTTHIPLTGFAQNAAFGLGNATGESATCTIDFDNPESTGKRVNFNFRCTFQDSGTLSTTSGGGAWNTNGAITGIKVDLSSGNIASIDGDAVLLGYPK